MDLVVAGTTNAGADGRVRGEASCPKQVMLGAVVFGHEQMQVVINAIMNSLPTRYRDPWTPPRNGR